MRSVILFTCLIAIGDLLAQPEKMIISFNQLTVLKHTGDVDYSKVLTSTVVTESLEPYSKEYDFKNSTVTCFHNDQEYFTGKIDSMTYNQQEGFVLYFTEKDLRNNRLIQTKQVIDLKNKKGYYIWYWDGEDDATFVEVEELVDIQVYPSF